MKEPSWIQTLILRNGGVIKTEDGTAIISVSAAGVVTVTVEDVTLTGDQVIGDSSADTLTVNATSTFSAPVTVGVDDTGYDVKFFGATSGKSWLWDESADKMIVTGDASVSGVTTLTGLVTLTAGIDAAVIFAGTETIAAGGTSTALDLTKTVHYIDADAGGDTFTLADGTEGQIMTIAMASATGTATITPANLRGGTSVTFNAAGDSVVLQFIASNWNILGGNSYAVV